MSTFICIQALGFNHGRAINILFEVGVRHALTAKNSYARNRWLWRMIKLKALNDGLGIEENRR